MCGIAGIVANGGTRPIRAMTDRIGHRGPDGEGFYEDANIALGHRRLSIIDLAGGKQPIGNEDGTIQLVCNGEIYNSPELRRELEAKGHTFKTTTDVEVILHLYEEYGDSCVQRLRGMFAYAIWDSGSKKLVLARDHLGQKPLFFALNNGAFLFASEIKALLAPELVRPKINLEALWHYISLRYIPDDLSLFVGVSKLPAATYLVYEKGSVKTTKYWDLDFNNKSKLPLADLTDGLDTLLTSTVQAHLLSDVTVGAFLSGGIDSSTVTALASKVSGKRMPVFSIGVEDQGYDELPYARMVAGAYDVEHHEKVVHADLIRLVPRMTYHMEEPSDPFGVGMFLASQLASEYVKVVLSGDGGDENFAGYDRYAGQSIVNLYSLLPQWLRNGVLRPLIGLIPETFGYKSLAQKAAWVDNLSTYSGGGRYAESLTVLRFTHDAKMQLFSSSTRGSFEAANSHCKVLKYYEANNASNSIDKMLYTDLMTRLPDHLLALVDRMSMAHSLEVRPVFVDKEVVEFAAAVPAHLKLKGNRLKYLLKKVAEKHLPRELIYRRKQGFSFPIGHWLRNDLSSFMGRLFEKSRFVETGVFDGQFIRQIVGEHLDGKVDHSYRLWILINLEYWYRLFIEQQSLEELDEFTDRLMYVDDSMG